MTSTLLPTDSAPEPPPYSGAAEGEEDAVSEVESLTAYFAACDASSSEWSHSSSSASSSPSPIGDGTLSHHAATVHPTDPDSKDAVGSALHRLEPLQGSASRPLLQHRLRTSVSESSSSMLDGSVRQQQQHHPPLPGSLSAQAQGTDRLAALSSMHLTTPPPGSDVSVPVRGAAGSDLAHRLQSAVLPLSPSSSPPLPLTETQLMAHTAAFAFATPVPAPAADTVKRRSSTTTTTTRTTTITTRGGGSQAAARTPDAVECAAAAVGGAVAQRRRMFARQRAVLFDALCALRQQPTASCVSSAASTSGSRNSSSSAGVASVSWHCRDTVLQEARAQKWSPTFTGALAALLRVASEVAAVEARVAVLDSVLAALADQRDRADAAAASAAAGEMAADTDSVQDATIALEVTGQQALLRLSRVVRLLHADFMDWVLQLQEYLVHLCTRASESTTTHLCPTRRGGAAGAKCPRTGSRTHTGDRGETVDGHYDEYDDVESAAMRSELWLLPPPCSLVEVVLATEENALPLQRCRVLIEDSGCLDGLEELLASLPAQGRDGDAEHLSQPKEADEQHKEEEEEEKAAQQKHTTSASFAVRASRLLDTLIIQASAVQDTSTMDLYRFYVMLLLYTAWPYVLLCTAAIFGFVRNIDPPVWRRSLPRLFRSSFSHVRIGDAHRHYPTDVLSMLLNCVGYYGSADANAGVSGNAAAVQWTPTAGAQGGRGGALRGKEKRRGDPSERRAAQAALASARTFVARSLASFTRRKKQVALSRTTSAVRGATTTSRQDAREGRRSAATAPWQRWETKSVRDILHYILYESGGQDTSAAQQNNNSSSGGGGGGAAVVAYALENQDVRRRLVQAPAAAPAEAHQDNPENQPRQQVPTHFRYFPTTIPLGVATMLAEALPGQQQWQQEREEAAERMLGNANAHLDRQGRADTAASHFPALPTSRAPPRGSESETDGGDEDGTMTDNLNGLRLLRRRALSLWTLFVSDSAALADIEFRNAYALNNTDEPQCSNPPLDGAGSSRQRTRRPHQLWLNVTIPCARWVTTALLIPIGVAVQRLQERRLQDLFAMSMRAVQRGGGLRGTGAGKEQNEEDKDDEEEEGAPRRRGGVGYIGGDGTGLLWRNTDPYPNAQLGEETERIGGDSGRGPLATPSTGGLARLSTAASLSSAAAAPACSFVQALRLLIDVALCRDQERIVVGFLERLYREPRWWARRWADGGAATFARLGTAAPAVTALFADALRGKRLSELVRLVVLPGRETKRERGSAGESVGTHADVTQPPLSSSSSSSSSSIAADILDMFASFQLEFSLPGAFTLILQPRDLCVFAQPLSSTTERSYQTFFWQRRRRLYVEEAASHHHSSSSTLSPSASDAPAGIPYSDVWSYVFGYQCSLYYAQITLREHKKQLHQRDTLDFQVAQQMGQPGGRVGRHLQYISRGLGSAYYTLTFAVDTLLSFTQGEAMRTVYELERLLAKCMRSSSSSSSSSSNSPNSVSSCMDLCYAMDSLLLQLHVVAFPARPAVPQNARECAMQSAAAEAVRGAVQRILDVALDPARLPVSYISSSTRNAVEALVAAVTAAGEHQSMLAARLHPLRVMLTFNKYYGSAEETLSYQFR